MKLPQFSKVNKHRRFDYTPMYYDERKEKMKKRIEKAEAEKSAKSGDENVAREVRMRSAFEQNAKSMHIAPSLSVGFVRGFIISAIVLYMCYYVFMNIEAILAYVTN